MANETIPEMVAQSLTDRALIDRMVRALASPRSFTLAERRAFIAEAKRRFNIDTEPTRCELCSEPLRDERAEMYDPSTTDGPSLIVHPDCGIAAGLAVA